GHVVGVAVLSFVIARLLSPAIALLLFFFLGSVDLRLLPSFPTRRSSDLHFSEERVRRPFSLRQNSPFLRLFVARVRRCRAGFGLQSEDGPHGPAKELAVVAYPHPFRPGPAGPISVEHADAPAPGTLVVDLDALARNYRRMRDAAAPAECAAVVKADAYGLGLAPVAARLALEGCTRFFVATVDEGRELRRLLPDATIYVLEGVPGGAAPALHAAFLTPVLNSLDQIACWTAAGGGAAILHIDTGMARLGLAESEVEALAAQPALLDGIDVEYVMTHLACADTPSHALNGAQLLLFERLRARLPAAPTSIGASAGTFLDRAHRGD